MEVAWETQGALKRLDVEVWRKSDWRELKRLKKLEMMGLWRMSDCGMAHPFAVAAS